MKIDNFFGELKRRNVYKVAVAYIVGGWALSQGIAQVFPVFDIPNWVIRLIVVLIIIGFPVAVVFAWVFELTPEGIKRTEVADAMPTAAGQKKRGWIYVVVDLQRLSTESLSTALSSQITFTSISWIFGST
jgi:hypothetical protein